MKSITFDTKFAIGSNMAYAMAATIVAKQLIEHQIIGQKSGTFNLLFVSI